MSIEISNNMMKQETANPIRFSHNKTKLSFLIQFIFLMSGTLLYSSCSEYLNGKPFKTSYLEIQSSDKLDCLDNVSSDMQKFLNSEGTDQEIDQTVECINGVLTELQIKVEGSVEASSFTANDIYNILAKFASATNISETAAQNLITMKAAVLGGESTKITKNEIDSLKNFLLLVKTEAKKIRPYIKLYYFEKTERQYNKEFIEDGFAQLNSSLKNLYKASQLSNSSYSVENFKEMMVNVLNLSGDDRDMAEIMAKISKVISGAHDILTDAERIIYIDNITEFLKLYSLHVNSCVQFSITTSVSLNETLNFTESVLNLIENSLQFRKTQMISSQTIDAFINVLVKSNFLDHKLTGYNTAMIYRTLLVRVFEYGAKGNIFNFTGVKKIHLRNIRRELATYKVYSKMIERVAGEQLFASLGITSAPIKEIQQGLASLNIADETEILNKFDSVTQSQIVNNVNDLRSEFLGISPVIYHNNKIGIAANQSSWKQNWGDLARGLYVKMLARLLMQGWGQIYPFENISTNYMTETDLFNWYSEIKSFGIEMKAFDPRKHNSGSAAFNTANLFTRAGNGDDRVTFNEVVENLGIVVSASGIFYNVMKNDLLQANCNLPELDVFDEHWNYEFCLQQLLRSKYKTYFSSLPYLVTYLNTLNEDQFKNYFESALNVVRLDAANSGNKVETSDILSANSLLHFIEEIYLKHDLNANWMISESEIRTAYPKFEKIATVFAHQNSQQAIDDFTSWKGELAGYGCFSEQDLIRESFIFLIYNGRTPEQSDFNSFPCIQDKPLIDFHGEVDRMKLINTFSALKSALGV